MPSSMTDITDGLGSVGLSIEIEGIDDYGRERFLVTENDALFATGKYYPGNAHIQPWIEMRIKTDLEPGEDWFRSFFQLLTGVLEPGSHLMIPYIEHERTAEALNVDVPPPATPLGYLMWQAGFRWYKDWYISEGFREGGQKLQANLPADEETRLEHERTMREQLESFVRSEEGKEGCVERARMVLQTLR